MTAATAKKPKPGNSPNVTFDRDELLKAVRLASACVGYRSTLPITACLLIEPLGNETRRIRATNLDTAIAVTVPAKEAGDVATPMVLPARNLLGILGALPKGSAVSFELMPREDRRSGRKLDDGGSGLVPIKVTSGPFEYVDRCGYEAGDFPSWPAPKGDALQWAEVSAPALKRAAEPCLMCVADDISRPVLTSVHYNDGHLAAADGFRLAVHDLQLNGDLPETCFAGDFLRLALRAFGATDQVLRIGTNRTQSWALGAGVDIAGQVVQGTFPNYGQLIPADWNTRITVPSATMQRALRLLGLVSRDGAGIIRIEAKPEGVTLRAIADEIGEATSTLLCPVEGDAGRIAFNWRYLVDMLKCIQGDMQLEWTVPSSQAVIRDTANPALVQILMPMFVQW